MISEKGVLHTYYVIASFMYCTVYNVRAIL